MAIPVNKSAMIILRGFDEPFLGHENPPENPSHVRVEVELGCVNIMYKSENQTQVSLIFNNDPKLALIPKSLVNFVTKKILYYFMKSIEAEVLAYPGSVHEQRV
jgi:hypothetical protein